MNRAEAEFKQRAEKLRPQLGNRYQLIAAYGSSGCDTQQLMALLNRAMTAYAHSFVSPSRGASDGADESSSDASEGDSEDPSDEGQSDPSDEGGWDESLDE